MSHVELKPPREHVQDLLKAVKVLIRQYPDEAPPRFREDFEAGKFFTAKARAGRAEEQLRVLDRALFLDRPTPDNPVRRPWVRISGWDHDVEMRNILHQLADVVIGLLERWSFPTFDGEKIIHCAPGTDLESPEWKQVIDDLPPGAILKPEVVPLITEGEYKTLIWIRDKLVAALAWAADQARAEARPDRPRAPLEGADDAVEGPRPAVEPSEATLVASLRKAEKPRQAAFVEYMIGRRESTVTDLMAALYGEDEEKSEDAIRKLNKGLTRSLEAIPSKIRYIIKSGYVYKENPVG
jgi:hypothetical protein